MPLLLLSTPVAFLPPPVYFCSYFISNPVTSYVFPSRRMISCPDQLGP